MKSSRRLILLVFIKIFIIGLFAQETQIIYLSGTGYDHTQDWMFNCTAGRKSGQWKDIPVPSNWELMGFGTYNYGYAADSVRAKEKGIYRYEFPVSGDWKDRSVNIVFEGVMTDAEVFLNGMSCGPVHQGAYYRFKYEVTNLLKYAQMNILEVTASKHSTNESVNRAERYGDFWIFGGIFRPVYLEIAPKIHIERIALDAQADGTFNARVMLSGKLKNGRIAIQITAPEGSGIRNKEFFSLGEEKTYLDFQTIFQDPQLWSPEFPNLYNAEFELWEEDKLIHRSRERFGFRTIELRPREGIYLNGVKIKFKGVCRHAFWPESGRTTSKDLSLQDALLIKDMNMNAVRNAHYPADEHFFDVCDSLGIMVMDELAGWHDAYDTDIGARLVQEMLESNMNHPSIVIWANGNEGGHNPALDSVFDSMDIQHRPVCHPWENFRGMDTQHYINYDYGNGTHFHGHQVSFPTEFLHGLYDGGHGAGLYDYWEYMWKHPLSAGGFLWDFSDNGIIRTDKQGEIDTDGDHAADGILGPYREKEGSYYSIKEVWSPIYFEQREITENFDGTFILENRYHFTNISQCTFAAELKKLPGPGGMDGQEYPLQEISSPDILPGSEGILAIDLPKNWYEFDILYVTAQDPHKREIYTWAWPISLPGRLASKICLKAGKKPLILQDNDQTLEVESAGIRFVFDRVTGLLHKVTNSSGEIPFNNGPVLCDGTFGFRGFENSYQGDTLIITYQLDEVSSFKKLKWMVYPSGWIALEFSYRPSAYYFDMMGVSFSFPEDLITGVRWMGKGPYRVWKNREQGTILGVWEKTYNNTITGVRDFIYPEFKGYHADFYWAEFLTKEQNFTVATASEDIYLRIFTPEFPEVSYNTAPVFPDGDISFMHGIPPMGTKSQTPENMGPSGRKNMYFDYWKQRAKRMTLFFDFSGTSLERQ